MADNGEDIEVELTGKAEGSKPITLIHGAFHGAWCWDAIVKGLTDLGFDVHAVDLPLTGFEDDLAASHSAIHERGGVIVGHSYGGAMIAGGSSGAENVSHLVFLAAIMLGDGQDWNELAARAPRLPISRAIVGHDDTRFAIDPDVAGDAFFHDVDEPDAANAIAKLRPMVLDGLEPADGRSPGWHTIPSTYVICQRDQAMHVQVQEIMAQNATTTVSWDTSHSPFLSRPELLIDLLADLASG